MGTTYKFPNGVLVRTAEAEYEYPNADNVRYGNERCRIRINKDEIALFERRKLVVVESLDADSTRRSTNRNS